MDKDSERAAVTFEHVIKIWSLEQWHWIHCSWTTVLQFVGLSVSLQRLCLISAGCGSLSVASLTATNTSPLPGLLSALDLLSLPQILWQVPSAGEFRTEWQFRTVRLLWTKSYKTTRLPTHLTLTLSFSHFSSDSELMLTTILSILPMQCTNHAPPNH